MQLIVLPQWKQNSQQKIQVVCHVSLGASQARILKLVNLLGTNPCSSSGDPAELTPMKETDAHDNSSKFFSFSRTLFVPTNSTDTRFWLVEKTYISSEHNIVGVWRCHCQRTRSNYSRKQIHFHLMITEEGQATRDLMPTRNHCKLDRCHNILN